MQLTAIARVVVDRSPTDMPLLFLILALTGGSAPLETTEAAPLAAESETAAAQRPTVYLLVEEELAQWLVVRLLEDGYPLTTSRAAAHAQLAVVADAEGGWSVTATGQSTVVFAVEPATDPAVLRLELLHRSIDALEDVLPAVPAQPQSPTVSLGLSAFSPALAPQIAAGILDAGATLVPTGMPAALRVCAQQHEGEQGPRIFVIDGAGECGAESGSEPVELGAAVLPSTTDLVAAAIATLAAAPEPGAQDAAESAEVEPAVPVPPEKETDPEIPPGLEPEPSQIRMPLAGAPYVLRGGVATGFVSRRRDVDALIAASMTIGREPGIRGWVELQVRPVTVVGALRVVEVTPAIGFKLRPLTVRRFSLETGLLVGPEIHRFRLEAVQVGEVGTHVGGSVESLLGVAIRVWKRHEVHVGLRVGGGRERIHRVERQEVWRRSALRIGATFGFTFGKELRK